MERGRESLPSREELIVSGAEARNELDRILSDPGFQCAERNKKFLRFVAEEFFAGRADSLKAYTIAVDVFGRPQSFDASIDPIVRIEATRLRSALIRYYEKNGSSRGIEIRLPKGHYAPEFARIPQRRKTDQLTPQKIGPIPVARFGKRLRHMFIALPRKAYLAAGAVMATAVLASAFLIVQHQSVRVTDKPTVSIEMASDGPEDARASALRDSLMIALSRFNALRLSADAYTASTKSRVRTDGETYGRYQIQLKYRADARSRSVWWQVIDQNSGEAMRAGEESAAIDDLSPNGADERLVSKLAVRLASMRGVINSIETAHDLDTPSLGNGCVLRAGLALNTRNSDLLTNARSCLERTLELRPYDADAHAMLSAVLLASDPDRRSDALTSLASDHADEAVALAPESDRSYMAQMMAAFRAGQLEKAKQAGGRAIALNPNNPAVAARYSSILFAMGDWKEAASLARKASQIDDVPQPEAERTLAFDAYRRGAYDEAAIRLQRMADSRCPLTQLLLAASLAQAGDEREAAAMLTTIKDERPDFEETFQTDMASRRLTPVLVDALGEGLRRAGSKVQ